MKIYKISLCIIIIALSIFNNAYANSSTANLKTKVNPINEIANFESVSGSFLQLQNTGNKSKEFNGIFSFQKPNKFIWEYQKPFKQIIQSDGKKLYIYDKDLKQVTTKNLDESISSSPIALFLNDKNWNKYFSSTTSEKNSITISNNQLDRLDKNIVSKINKWILLKPKAKDSIYQYLSVGTINSVPQILIFQDNLGNSGVIQINNLINQKFKQNDFNFIIPKGVDIINN